MSEPAGIDGWEMVVGLEVHVELATATKLFCGCRNPFGDEPNTNIVPGLPRPARARCRCSTGRRSSWPCGSAGPWTAGRAVDLRPEELLLPGHAEGLPGQPVRPADQRRRRCSSCPTASGSASSGPTSRRTPASRPTSAAAGASTTPTTPSSTTTAPACRWSRSWAGPTCAPPSRPRPTSTSCGRSSLATGVSDAKMEEGSMRVDANVSVRRVGDETLGTRCEIKNLNSLRSLGRAIDYEARRQVDLLEAGRAGRARRPATGTRRTAAPTPCVEGGGRRLPLLPRARPGAAGARRRLGRPHRRRAARPARRPPGRAGRGRRREPRPTWPSSSTAGHDDAGRRRHRRRRRRPHRCSPTSSTTWPATAPSAGRRAASPRWWRWRPAAS